jgi:hypothetical protein
MILLRSSDNSEMFRKKSGRLETRTKIISFFIFCLVCSRLTLCLLTPPELIRFSYLSTEITHLLLTGLIFSVLWAMIWYFIAIKSEIKIEERVNYLRRLHVYTAILSISDLLITLLLSFQGYRHMFDIQATWHNPNQNVLSAYLPLLIVSLILLGLLSILYTLYIFRRSIKILKQYWLALLLLLISTILFTVLSGTVNLGWYDYSRARLLIFSWQYAYFGWIFLLLISITVFCNAASIILLSITNKFVNPVKFRNLSITLIKMGFITTLAFTLLSFVPDLLLWIYT